MAPPNWGDKTIWTGDNLPIMRGMNSESVDLLYLDPPFNSKADYAAPIGSVAAGAAFKDTWTLTDLDVEWINLIEGKHPALWRVLLAAMTPSDKSYLVYMAIRLLEMRRLLKPTGSIYLHCDPTMSHYLKLVMDAIYGRNTFRNEIVWCYTGPGNTPRDFKRKHDVILRYVKSSTFFFNLDAVRLPHKRAQPSGGRTSMAAAGRSLDQIHKRERELIQRGKAPEDWWVDIGAGSHMPKAERVGYPTQKPLALLDRIIKASLPPDGIVLDPFCGCATTLVAADDLGRQWSGIDISPKAAELVVERIAERQGLFRDITHRTDIPQRTDLGKLPPPPPPIANTCTVSKKATALDALRISRPGILKLITLSLARRAAPTTLTTCSYYARTATESKATEAWSISELSSTFERLADVQEKEIGPLSARHCIPWGHPRTSGQSSIASSPETASPSPQTPPRLTDHFSGGIVVVFGEMTPARMTTQQRLDCLLKHLFDITPRQGDGVGLEARDVELLRERCGFADHSEIAFYVRSLDGRGLVNEDCSADNTIIQATITIDGYCYLDTLR